MKKATSRIAAWIVLLACAAAGCSKDTVHEVEVSGNVTIDGLPVPRGTVTFIAADGTTPTGGGVIEDGRYTAKVPPGEKVVLVLGNVLVGQEPEFPDMPNSSMLNKYETITPPEYNAQHLTPLKATISGPQEGVDFALKKNVKST